MAGSLCFAIYWSVKTLGKLVKTKDLEVDAGSKIFDLNYAHYQKGIKPTLTDNHLPKPKVPDPY